MMKNFKIDKITDIEYYAKLEEKRKTAKNMLKDGISINKIMKYTGLSETDISHLK